MDDDLDVQKAARLLLERAGLRVTSVKSPEETWSVMAAEPVDVILLDLNFSRGSTSGEEGFRHLVEIITHDPTSVVVVITGHSGVNIAVAAMRAGAADFVMKPWNNERLLATVKTAVELRHRRQETLSLKLENAALNNTAFGPSARILGESPAIERVREIVRRAAPTEAAVLIYGAAGVGKSLIARSLHMHSDRPEGPFLAVELAGLPADDADRALFGDEAVGGDPGAFIAARGGTLYLDEVGDLAPQLQARLYGVLDSGNIISRSVGRPLAIDVRVVASTRKTRDVLHGYGGLRDDLLYKLNTVEVFAPSLQERGSDALLLARHFLRFYALRHGRPLKPLSDDASAGILQHTWVGDVRELRQRMERCVIFSEGEDYAPSDLQIEGLSEDSKVVQPPGSRLMRSERSLVAAALKRSGSNVSHAAKELGLSRAALYRRMAKHGL